MWYNVMPTISYIKTLVMIFGLIINLVHIAAPNLGAMTLAFFLQTKIIIIDSQQTIMVSRSACNRCKI
jgi:hypothetical protein